MTTETQIVCSNCEIPIRGKPIQLAGGYFCCSGCVVGGPCICDYTTLAAPVAQPPTIQPASPRSAPPVPTTPPQPPVPTPVSAPGLQEPTLRPVPPPAPAPAPIVPETFAVPAAEVAPPLMTAEPVEPAVPAPAPPDFIEPEAPTWPSNSFEMIVNGVEGDDEARRLTERLRAIASPGQIALLSFVGDTARLEITTEDRTSFLEFLPSLPDMRLIIDDIGETITAHVDHPAVAQTVNLIASRFDSFARLNEFVSEVRELPGVRDVRMRRLVQGVLHLAVDYEAPIPLTHRLRELRSFRVRIGSADADGIEVFVTPIDERVTGGR